MQHDLVERVEGQREPRDLPLIRLALAAAALGLALQGCGPAAMPVVMVSGRDDHGLLQRPAIGLQASPTDPAIVGSVEDGRFVWIVATDGPWRRVRSVERPDVEGWIPDEHLRGEAVRTDVSPPARVRFLEAKRDGDVLVRVRDQSGSEAWVPARALREVGAR